MDRRRQTTCPQPRKVLFNHNRTLQFEQIHFILFAEDIENTQVLDVNLFQNKHPAGTINTRTR